MDVDPPLCAPVAVDKGLALIVADEERGTDAVVEGMVIDADMVVIDADMVVPEPGTVVLGVAA